MPSIKEDVKAKIVPVTKKFLNAKKNERKPVSGKRLLNHINSQRNLTKKQKLSIKKRAAIKSKEIKTPRFPRAYAIQQSKNKLQHRKIQCFKDHKRHIRASITPGTVLILLAGRHKGKRVVFLKSLDSGMLLVTGPFKYNGVPLRRVSQRYVIATSTRVKMGGIRISKELNDSFFRRMDLKPKTKNVEIFTEEVKKYSVSDDRKKFQKEVDTQLIAAIKKRKILSAYLKAMFSLSSKDYPHKMVF